MIGSLLDSGLSEDISDLIGSSLSLGLLEIISVLICSSLFSVESLLLTSSSSDFYNLITIIITAIMIAIIKEDKIINNFL